MNEKYYRALCRQNTINFCIILIVLSLFTLLLSFQHHTTLSKIKEQTMWIKNVSAQLSELRSGFTILPNPDELLLKEENR